MQQTVNDPHRRHSGKPFDIKACFGAPGPLPTPPPPDAPGVGGCSAEEPIGRDRRACGERGPGDATLPGWTVRVAVKGACAAGGMVFPQAGVYYLADVHERDLKSLRSKLIDRKVWQWIVDVCEPMYWARAEAWLFSANGGADPKTGFPQADTYSMAVCPDSVWRVAHDLVPGTRENVSAFKGTGSIWSIDVIEGTEKIPVNLETTTARGAQSQADMLTALREQNAAMHETNKQNAELMRALLAERKTK